MGQDAVLIVAIALGAIAVVVAVATLFAAGRTQAMLRARPAAPDEPTADRRRAFANLLRRYSEMLGVEVVTGRVPSRGDTSTALRVELETELGRLREPGAVELLDEVGYAREALLDLEPRRRAAANGLVAMQIEWSIERWASNPRAWLADCREQDRLTRIAQADTSRPGSWPPRPRLGPCPPRRSPSASTPATGTDYSDLAAAGSALIAGDAHRILAALPDGIAQTVVTSPPYWSLRDYGIDGQLGLEPTRARVHRGARRPVRRRAPGAAPTTGRCGSTSATRTRRAIAAWRAPDRKNVARAMGTRPPTPDGLKPKDLIGVPWRLAFALQERGWYLRSDLVWNKPNAQPESVGDRPTRSHEYLFLLIEEREVPLRRGCRARSRTAAACAACGT